jgi:hypothetical protein
MIAIGSALREAKHLTKLDLSGVNFSFLVLLSKN